MAFSRRVVNTYRISFDTTRWYAPMIDPNLAVESSAKPDCTDFQALCDITLPHPKSDSISLKNSQNHLKNQHNCASRYDSTAKFGIKEDCAYKLSILLVTYNHEKYIREALFSLFAQKIEGPVELVIADDASSDNTLHIIHDFELRNPGFHFKYLDNKINSGITRNYQRGFAACNGEYIAVLEGDDYWHTNEKLQRQVDFLDNHPECTLCSVNYLVFEEEQSKSTPRVPATKKYRYLKAQDLIMDNLIGNFSTCMYRRSAVLKLPDRLYELRSYDWIINICVALNSFIGFLEEPMSVYRIHQNGVWSSLNHIEKIEEQMNLIPEYNALTNFQFNKEFSQLLTQLNKAKIQLLTPPEETEIGSQKGLRLRYKNLVQKLRSLLPG